MRPLAPFIHSLIHSFILPVSHALIPQGSLGEWCLPQKNSSSPPPSTVSDKLVFRALWPPLLGYSLSEPSPISRAGQPDKKEGGAVARFIIVNFYVH